MEYLDNISLMATPQTDDHLVRKIDLDTKLDETNVLVDELKSLNTNLATEVTTKTSKTYVDTLTASIASGSPKPYATLALLQSAFPTGDTKNYVVVEDGKWYYWNGLGAWVVGGTYQSTGIADKSINYNKTDFLTLGKNLFDKTKRTLGYWVVYNTGGLTASAPYDSSDFIPVIAGTTYTINKCRNLALYNSSKVYISGVNNTSYASATFTPTQDGFVRYATGTAFVDTSQIEVGNVVTNYERYCTNLPLLLVDNINLNREIVDNTNIKNETITDQKINPTSNIVIKKQSENIIHLGTLTNGYYVRSTDGNLIAISTTSATGYIEITPNIEYTLSLYNSTHALEQMAYYDVNKLFVSGLTNSGTSGSVTFVTPTTAKYIRLTLVNSLLNLYQLEKGNIATSYKEPGNYIKVNEIEKGKLTSDYFVDDIAKKLAEKVTITVKQDGTGDFVSLRAAVDSITDNGELKQYTVKLYEGVYDIFSYYTTEELNNVNFVGLQKQDYVSFIGVGDKENITLKGEMPLSNDVITSASKIRISTIWANGNGSLENLTITNLRCEYAVHDDRNIPNSILYVKDCDFKTFKSSDNAFYGGKQAWGEGTWNGQQRTFEDCTFRTEWNYYGYTTHNTQGQTKKDYHKFINCKFSANGSNKSIRFQSLNGQISKVEMIGCSLSGGIQLEPIAPYTGIKHVLKGYGNTKTFNTIANTDGLQYAYEFIDECESFHNVSEVIVTKGQPVMYDSSGVSILPLELSNILRFVGVAMQDIPNGTSGIIRISGYLPIRDTSLTGLVVGDKIGVVDGSLAKVTTGDYIGVVTLSDYILLKY